MDYEDLYRLAITQLKESDKVVVAAFNSTENQECSKDDDNPCLHCLKLEELKEAIEYYYFQRVYSLDQR